MSCVWHFLDVCYISQVCPLIPEFALGFFFFHLCGTET